MVLMTEANASDNPANISHHLFFAEPGVEPRIAKYQPSRINVFIKISRLHPSPAVPGSEETNAKINAPVAAARNLPVSRKIKKIKTIDASEKIVVSQRNTSGASPNSAMIPANNTKIPGG